MLKFSLSALMLAGLAACSTVPETLPFEIVVVPAMAETDPMISVGDRADDPAVWVNAADPSKSLILGTDKESGLYVYDLSGKTRQFLKVGRINNVDIRERVAVASNDETEALSWFQVSTNGDNPVTHLADTPVGKPEPYGVCLGMDFRGLIAAATYKDGTVQLWRGTPANDGTIAAALERTVKLASQLEGCVFHEPTETLFIGEEAAGIWALSYADEIAQPVAVDMIADGNGLVEDTEGLSIWRGDYGTGYLVASAQAADRFVVYDVLPPYTPRGIFKIGASADGSVDAVSHTDGLDVVSAPLPGYPSGLLVVQDDANPESGKDQNFKLVDWSSIDAALGLSQP